MIEVLLVWLAFAVCCGLVAGAKGRSSLGWFILGMLFSIFALIVIAVIPSVMREPRGHRDGAINMTGNSHYSEKNSARRALAILFAIGLVVFLYNRVISPAMSVRTDVEAVKSK